MKFARTAFATFAVALGTFVVDAGASTVPTWKGAQTVTLPNGGSSLPQGYLPDLSCPSTGNCIAAGDFVDNSSNNFGFIANEVMGTWKVPITIVPPSNAATKPGLTPYGSSCATAGNCVVVGNYVDGAGDSLGFVASEVGGSWHSATQVPLPPNALGAGQTTLVSAVSCPSNASCTAVGSYSAASASPLLASTQGVILSEVKGSWRAAVIALPANANVNPMASLGQVACSTAGSCVATGTYVDTNSVSHGLIVTDTAGVWSNGAAMTLPANAGAYPNAKVSSLACASVRSCTAIGTYLTRQIGREGFTIGSTNGVWHRAVRIKLPAGAGANPRVFFFGFAGVSCPAVASCTTGGQYVDASGNYQGFVLNQVKGVWQTATVLQLPAGASMVGPYGGAVAVTCVAAGTCSEGAAYLDARGDYQALVVSEVADRWVASTTMSLPSGATAVGIDGGVYGLVCPASGGCTASGSYLDARGSYQGFTATAN